MSLRNLQMINVCNNSMVYICWWSSSKLKICNTFKKYLFQLLFYFMLYVIGVKESELTLEKSLIKT